MDELMPAPSRCRFGVPGLDAILYGGLPPGHLFLLEGQPGSGKTTLSLQFLLEGVKAGERCLYVTLSETADELVEVASSHGWDLQGIDLFELSSVEEVLGEGRNQSVFHSWEVELGETIRLIRQQVERIEPTRVVFDSLSELRAGPAALPPPGAGAEAVLRTAQHHGAVHRRPDRRRPRP
jgi:circadian clock protein KaiC